LICFGFGAATELSATAMAGKWRNRVIRVTDATDVCEVRECTNRVPDYSKWLKTLIHPGN
jgi:hypothetical protein